MLEHGQKEQRLTLFLGNISCNSRSDMAASAYCHCCPIFWMPFTSRNGLGGHYKYISSYRLTARREKLVTWLLEHMLTFLHGLGKGPCQSHKRVPRLHRPSLAPKPTAFLVFPSHVNRGVRGGSQRELLYMFLGRFHRLRRQQRQRLTAL